MCHFSGGKTSKLALSLSSLSSKVFDDLRHSEWPAGLEALFYTFRVFVKQNLPAGGQEQLRNAGGVRGYVRKNLCLFVKALDIRTYANAVFVAQGPVLFEIRVDGGGSVVPNKGFYTFVREINLTVSLVK